MADAWSPEAEEGVLGAMMLHERAKSEAAEAGLAARDFYRPVNAQIFKILDQAEGLLNPIIVIDLLEKAGSLPSADSKPTIMAMTDHACLVSQVRHYAQIVRDHAALRRLAAAGRRITQLAEATEGDVGPRLTEAEDAITEAVQESAGGTVEMLAAPMLAHLKLVSKREPIHYLSSGFKRLDDVLIGLRPGKLIVLAARPGQGKTTFAINVIENVAKRGTTTALFSLEMGSVEVGNKLLAGMAGVDYKRLVDLRTPISEADLAKVRQAWPKLEALPLFVNDKSNTTMSEVRAKARALKRTHNLGLLVVDYLQLMVHGNTDNRNNEVAAITRSMKVLARELEVPILLLSQLNRNIEARKEKQPMLSDLRDSGATEQDADQVVFIHRPELYEGPNSDKAGVAELIIAKNRDGELGHVNLTFVGRKSRFLEVVAARDDEPAVEEAKAFGVT